MPEADMKTLGQSVYIYLYKWQGDDGQYFKQKTAGGKSSDELIAYSKDGPFPFDNY